MNKEELLIEFKKAQKELVRLEKLEDTAEKRETEKLEVVSQNAERRTSKIDEWEEKRRDEIIGAFRIKEELLNDKKQYPKEVMGNMEEIISCFDIDLEDFKRKKDYLEKEGGEFILEIIKKKYLLLKVRIVNNYKPVNRYELSFDILTPFEDCKFHIDKCDSNSEDLKGYWKRNGKKRLRGFLDEYTEKENGFENFLKEEYNKDKRFIKIHLLKQKRYCERNYYGGTEKAKYLEIIKKLMGMSRGKEKQNYSIILKDAMLKKLQNETE